MFDLISGRVDLDQLRRQAKELLRAARAGNPTATRRIRAVSDQLTLAAAQLTLAREHGVGNWPTLVAQLAAAPNGLVTECVDSPLTLPGCGTVRNSTLSATAVGRVSAAEVGAFRAAIAAMTRHLIEAEWHQRGVGVRAWGPSFLIHRPVGRATTIEAVRKQVWLNAFSRVDPLRAVEAAGLSQHPARRRVR